MREDTLGLAASYQQTLDDLASLANGLECCVAIFIRGMLQFGTSFHPAACDEEVINTNHSRPAVVV